MSRYSVFPNRLSEATISQGNDGYSSISLKMVSAWALDFSLVNIFAIRSLPAVAYCM